MRIVAGLSKVLYHITSAQAAASIMRNNRFELKTNVGTNSEREIHDHPYYLSTSRNRSNDYFKRNASTQSVIFVLDGEKLNQRYSGGPVDYWAGTGMNKPGLGNDEQEDRIFSTKPFVEPATEFIREIHVMWDREAGEKDRDQRPNRAKAITTAYYELYRGALLAGIPIYFYGFADSDYEKTKPSDWTGESYRRWASHRPSNLAEQAFLLLDKRRADPAATVRQLFENVVRFTEIRDDYSRKYGNPPKADNGIAPWLFLYHIPVTPDMDSRGIWDYVRDKGGKKAEDAMRMLSWYPRDAVTRISNEIHNSRGQPYGRSDKVRENIDSLVQILRRERVDVKGFIELLRKRFRLDQR